MLKRQVNVAIAGLLSVAGLARAQFNESWDSFPAADWVVQNNSAPIGMFSWGPGFFETFPPYAGSGYVEVDYECGDGLATLSNWLISPVVPLTNGAQMVFYTRTVDTPFFPDRLQVRMNSANTGTNVGTLPEDVGDFTGLLLDINPTYSTTGYPSTWTEYTVTISGITGTVNGRLAFRYFVENGGPSGDNSEYIGIDETTYSLTPPPAGRCCLLDGTCQVLTQNQCSLSGGNNWVSGQTCAGLPCPPPPSGACCLLSGCEVLSIFNCVQQNGVFKGDATTCAGSICPTVYVYEGLAITIPDGEGSEVCGEPAIAEITVNDSFTIASIDVAFHISHAWQGDVSVKLTKVGGPSVFLVNRPGHPASTYGFSFDNYGGSTADTEMFRSIDTAADIYDEPATFGINNVKGLWKPEEPLSAFVGLSSQGTWRLEVFDCAGALTGSLASFKLSLGGGPGTCYANCDGSTGTPALTANDFQCFINAYAGNLPFANCDGSTGTPALTANDFQCFINKYAGGCP